MFVNTCLFILTYGHDYILLVSFVHQTPCLKKNIYPETTAWRLVNGIQKSPADSQAQSSQFAYFGCARKLIHSTIFFSSQIYSF